MTGMASLSRRVWLAAVLLPLLCGRAQALLPPLTDYKYNDGEREIELKVPDSWHVQKVQNGLRAQRDPLADVGGTVVLGFYEYEQAPTPDAFLKDALAAWAGQYDAWQVVEQSAPAERPRVRLATVGFRQYGVACQGYVMAVIGRQTGTIGFAYAETSAAQRMRLGDLVQLVVAGSFTAFPVRGEGTSPEAGQAIAQAYERLYGSAGRDFKAIWQDLEKEREIDPKLIDFCGTYQPELRQLKATYQQYLTERYKARAKEMSVYCLPTKTFNAFALGKNDIGPGFLAFHAALTRAFANLAQQYTYLRARNLSVKDFGPELTSYSTRLAEAVVRGQEQPPPGKIDFADKDVVQRYQTVFHGMIGLVMAHEMAHYYLRHNISGQDFSEPHTVQQRELQADSAALDNIQAAADKDNSVWEGGSIHAFGFLATVDNVVQRLSGAQKKKEYFLSHPYGETRFKLAAAALGKDNFQFRNDPWTKSTRVIQGDDGVDVIGGTGPVLAVLKHPKSNVEFTVPEGWTAHLDNTTGTVTFQREGGGSLPLMVYSCGGEYPSAEAICTSLVGNFKKKAGSFTEGRNKTIKSGNDKIKVHLIDGTGDFSGNKVALLTVGIQSPGWNHGLILLTTPANLARDSKAVEQLVLKMRFPMK